MDALGSIRTILAFGAQGKIVKMNDDHLQAAYKAGNNKALVFSVLFSSQPFSTLARNALAFWQGARL